MQFISKVAGYMLVSYIKRACSQVFYKDLAKFSQLMIYSTLEEYINLSCVNISCAHVPKTLSYTRRK